MKKQVEVQEPQNFDLRTHFWDRETRRLAHKNPYRMWAIKGKQYYERPVGSGNLFWKDGSEAGRMLDFETQKIDEKAAHVAYVPPRSPDAIREEEIKAIVDKNMQLERELAEIRKEKSAAPKESKVKSEEDGGDLDGIAVKNTRSN